MMQDKTILVVEDEPDIQELICYHLAKEGFTLRKANSGKEALERIQQDKPDLVLLDLMLPVLSGIEVLKTIRFTWGLTGLPVIIVSARTDESDIIMGLELGADNYLPKPFSPKVLVANVKALLRRTLNERQNIDITEEPQHLTVGVLDIDQLRHEAFWAGNPILLTATEFSLLTLLASNPGRVYTRNQIISGIRGDDYPVTERAIDVQVASLRRKMGIGGQAIKTVWGIGYSFQDNA
jgi:two-component system, OmpR family, alkaline phosphatase synthesis response regulator PhoP